MLALGRRESQSRGRPARRKWKRYSPTLFYAFVSPWVLGFLALTLVPMIYALLVSFTNYDGIDRWRWVGLSNYSAILHDADALYSLGRTALYTVITVPLIVAGSLFLAILLNRRMRGIGIFRTLYYLPAIVPVVAATIMWQSIFDRDSGALNGLIEALGGSPVGWLLDPNAFKALLVLIFWGLGSGVIIFLAGLQGVPVELQEAAALDGANPVQAFVRVTLPLLTPVIFFQLVVNFIGSLQTFVQPLLLAQTRLSGLSGTSNVPRGNYLYMVHVYDQFFLLQRFGYGSALLWVLFAALVLFTIIFFRSSPFWVYYEVDRDAA